MSAMQFALIDDSHDDANAIARVFRGTAEIQHFTSTHTFAGALVGNPDLLVRFDLILVDLNLPGEDGITLIHTIRNAPGGTDIPLVMLTGSYAESDIERALKAGVTEYEVKPNDTHGLKTLAARCTQLAAAQKPTNTPAQT